MAEVQIADFGTSEAPLDRATKPSEAFQLLAGRAVFDGTGASGDFVPVLEVISDAGLVVGTYPADVTVTAGGSAEVSFAPFLRTATSSTGTAGNWILVERQTNNGAGGFDFQNIPQDARTLVIHADFKPGNTPYPMTFNNDGGAHYDTLAEFFSDVGAGPAQTYTTLTGQTYIALLATSGTSNEPSGLVVTIPGYRETYSTGNRRRVAHIVSWNSGFDVGTGKPWYKRTETSAFWNNNPGGAASAITRIALMGNGADGEAMLYKVT